ncbi:MAG: type I DNA topoisomerase [Clostridia bacterium]|nr:type I DNA topoisomerase [Clostridia bacterium]
MAKYLVIVESPAKSKTIKKYLGTNYRVEASMGHIRDLPKSKLGVDIKNDFEPQYINIRGKGDLIKTLKDAVKKSERIFLATDPDREGEAISWHLYTALGLEGKKVSRIEFHEITESAIKNAMKEARDIDMNLVDAQQARRMLDRLVGYQISPILWKKVAKGLSAGRVQSVALKLVCDREEAIEKFEPQEYWTLDAENMAGNEPVLSKLSLIDNEKVAISSKEDMTNIITELKKEKFIVDSVKNGERQRNPFMPFKTSTLQQAAFQRLGFGTRKTMQIAQQLYEGVEISGHGFIGLITYMRTDSTRLSDEFKSTCADFIEEIYGQNYLGNFDRKEKATKNMQDAHEGIRVTDPRIMPNQIKNELTPDQYKLYKLIWERAIASLMAPAVYNTIGLDIKAGKYLFKASGSNLKFDGFMKCYETTKEEDEDIKLPNNLEPGMELKLKSLDEKQHFTEPPARFTEGSLVKELEENGIGRPSTYSTIINTIIDRRYVEKDDKRIIPTELGGIVNDLMCNYFTNIVSVSFTADIEDELDKIAQGEKAWKELIKQFYDGFQPLLENAENQIGGLEITPEVSDEICEKCGRNLVFRQSRYGKFLACPGFPDCRFIKPITVKTGTKCPKCGEDMTVKKSKKGRTYFECINFDKGCDFRDWDMPLDEICPKCGKQLFQTGMRFKKSICKNPECEDCQVNVKEDDIEKKTTKKTTVKKTTKKKTTKKKTTKKTTTKKTTKKTEE